MERTEIKYSFHFNKEGISWRQGQKPPVLEFLSYSDDTDFCAVTALDNYILRNEEVLTIMFNEATFREILLPSSGNVNDYVAYI